MSSTSCKAKPALHFGGIILAGGRSRRMGRPKAWLPVGERTMLATVVEAVEKGLLGAYGPSEASRPPLVVVGAPGQELPSLPDRVVRVDDEIEGEGPLRGMAAGLDALRGRADAAYVSSCDTPLLRPGFVTRMLSLLGDAEIVVPLVEGRHHPLAAVYRLSVLPMVRDLLTRQMRRPFFLFERSATRIVGPEELSPADRHLVSLRNFNTPDEYRELLKLIAPVEVFGRPT